MKLLSTVLITAALMLTVNTSYAQTAIAETNIENPNALPEAKAPEMISAKEVILNIKNMCEKHITIFAGSKKEVFDGKSQTLGGMSTNNLYLKEGDVVCIMNDPKTIQACSVIKNGITKVEINKSGNGFVK